MLIFLEGFLRDMLFISHANPEDNEFSMWLALQLAKEGYPVWCDLTKLLGGEDFWKDVEEAIRERTIKVIYVLSKTSNKKIGPLQELQVAQVVAKDLNLKDFVIPLLIDDLPHKEINIQLSRINAIPFNSGWAKGFKILLDKLEQEGVQKSSKFNPESVTSWWRNQFSAEQGVFEQPDKYSSNWFPISSFPEKLYFHELKRLSIGKVEVPDELPYPAFQHGLNLISFAEANDFKKELGEYMTIGDSYPVSIDTFLRDGLSQPYINRKQSRDFIFRLLRLAWEKFIKTRKLPIYELADQTKCFYFTKDMVKNDNLHFMGTDGNKTYRSVVGFKTIKDSKRFWHFAVQAKPLIYPSLAYIVKPHVLFSDDGIKVWESKERMHAARRSQCKDWWNPDWRDRILATMAWLANDKDKIEIQLGSSNTNIYVSSSPMAFDSPVSFTDPKEEIHVIDYDDDRDEEIEESEEFENYGRQ
jgi:hypothetical protein